MPAGSKSHKRQRSGHKLSGGGLMNCCFLVIDKRQDLLKLSLNPFYKKALIRSLWMGFHSQCIAFETVKRGKAI